MNKQDFEKMRNEVFEKCTNITKSKGDDYTKGNVDVLSNFKEGGSQLGVPPMKTLGIFMKKHTDAINNYIKNEGQCESEPISERIADAINYLIFLQAIIKDEENGQP